jgi:hypothetical protein
VRQQGKMNTSKQQLSHLTIVYHACQQQAKRSVQFAGWWCSKSWLFAFCLKQEALAPTASKPRVIRSENSHANS